MGAGRGRETRRKQGKRRVGTFDSQAAEEVATEAAAEAEMVVEDVELGDEEEGEEPPSARAASSPRSTAC